MTTSYGRHADDDTAGFTAGFTADPAVPRAAPDGLAGRPVTLAPGSSVLAADPVLPADPDPTVLPGESLDTAVLADGIDLDAAPLDDDLAEQLAARAPKRWANRATVVLAGLVLLVGGFLGGVQVQKHFGKSSAQTNNPFANSAAARNALGRFGGTGTGQGGTGQTGATGQGGTGAATTGTVKLVDGTTVYIQTASGDTVTVKTGSNTSVQVNGALKDLATGSTVSIQGQTGTDGTVTATSITKTK